MTASSHSRKGSKGRSFFQRKRWFGANPYVVASSTWYLRFSTIGPVKTCAKGWYVIPSFFWTNAINEEDAYFAARSWALPASF